MNRRKFLIWGGITVIGGSIGLSVLSSCVKSEQEGILLSTLLPPSTLNAIGAAYLKQHPTIRPIVIGKHSARALSRQIAEEFEAEKVGVWDGWVLSDTEARYCASLILQ